MKKYTKVLALALALTMMLSMSVFAEGTIGSAAPVNEYAEEVIIGAAKDEETYVGEDKLSVTYKGTAENAMYLLLVLTDTYNPESEEPLSESHIKYVNQETADANGDVTFDKVYPADIVDSVVYLAGGDFASSGLTAVANIKKYEEPEPDFVLGDVNGDGNVSIADYQRLYRHLDNSDPLGEELKRGDINEDGSVSIADLQRLYRHLDNSDPLVNKN